MYCRTCPPNPDSPAWPIFMGLALLGVWWVYKEVRERNWSNAVAGLCFTAFNLTIAWVTTL